MTPNRRQPPDNVTRGGIPFPAAVRPRVRQRFFGSAANTLTTIAGFALLAMTLPPFFRWAVLDATWSLPASACLSRDGACWTYVVDKGRFVLFGFYPPAEQWRPTACILMFVGMIALSAFPKNWSRRLVCAWVAYFGASAILLRGGVLGLAPVETDKWSGLPLTLLLAVTAIVAAYPFGILLALGRRSRMPIIRTLAVVYIEVIRGIPLICLLFMSSVVFPLFLPKGFVVNKLLRAQAAIVMSSAAYLAEVIRGGLQAIDHGQYEAADSIGLSYFRKMQLVILPQALKIVIPPTVNTFISMLKDTSLVIVIALYDLMKTTQTSLADPTWMGFSTEAYLFAAAIYFPFCFFMSRYSRYLEHRLGKRTTVAPQEVA
jgi:general L-amino acid transport system permease protein